MSDEKIEPEPNPEDRKREPEKQPDPPPASPPEGGSEPEPERVEEVEATPIDAGEAASGPTIDAPPPPGSGSAGASSPGRTYLWATLTHLAGLASIPFLYVGGIVGPLIVWQLKEADEPNLAHHGREAINFQLNMLAWTLISVAVAAVLSYVPCCCAVILLPLLVQAYNIAFTIIAAVRASEGELFRYPGILRLF